MPLEERGLHRVIFLYETSTAHRGGLRGITYRGRIPCVLRNALIISPVKSRMRESCTSGSVEGLASQGASLLDKFVNMHKNQATRDSTSLKGIEEFPHSSATGMGRKLDIDLDLYAVIRKAHYICVRMRQR